MLQAAHPVTIVLSQLLHQLVVVEEVHLEVLVLLGEVLVVVPPDTTYLLSDLEQRTKGMLVARAVRQLLSMEAVVVEPRLLEQPQDLLALEVVL